MRDLHNNINVLKSVAAQKAQGTTDITGADVDVQGFESLEHVVTVGTSGDTLSGALKMDLILEHADADSTGGAAGIYSAVISADDVVGGTVDASGIFASVNSNALANAVYKIGYIGAKRFTRVKIDLTGTHTNGTNVAGLALLGNANLLPVS